MIASTEAAAAPQAIALPGKYPDPGRLVRPVVRVSRALDHGRGRNDHVKRRRNTPAQIIRKLREADRLLGEGRTVPEVAKARVRTRGRSGSWLTRRWRTRRRSLPIHEPAATSSRCGTVASLRVGGGQRQQR
jgi:hypothetical protein